MLVFAHDLQGKLDSDEYPDQATLAARLGFTRGRLPKHLDLTLLDPDIQEEFLHLEAVDGVEPLAERALHDVVRHEWWTEQRRAWVAIEIPRGMPKLLTPPASVGDTHQLFLLYLLATSYPAVRFDFMDCLAVECRALDSFSFREVSRTWSRQR